MTLSDIMHEINRRMTGGDHCPTKGSLGECPAADTAFTTADGTSSYFFSLSIWDDAFNDSALIAGWFKELGAVDVIISHVLHDTMNYDVAGRCTLGGGRNWTAIAYFAEELA